MRRRDRALPRGDEPHPRGRPRSVGPPLAAVLRAYPDQQRLHGVRRDGGHLAPRGRSPGARHHRGRPSLHRQARRRPRPRRGDRRTRLLRWRPGAERRDAAGARGGAECAVGGARVPSGRHRHRRRRSRRRENGAGAASRAVAAAVRCLRLARAAPSLAKRNPLCYTLAADPGEQSLERKDPLLSDLSFDIVIIGGGPGGYVGAIRAAQLGARTALIERDALGGTCLNRGCIPSKALISCVEALYTVKEASAFGIEAQISGLDLDKMRKHADRCVKQLVSGVEGLMQKNGVTVFRGHGTLRS
ncbi:MAG: FAD-dependent oxidoreductase, partial [Armatimonadetes bacterium]|nr:FAD-dependent oxidoreductase [Armatimonadota bacterium]